MNNEVARTIIPTHAMVREKERREIETMIDRLELRDAIIDSLVEDGIPAKSAVRFAELVTVHSLDEIGRWLSSAKQVQARL